MNEYHASGSGSTPHGGLPPLLNATLDQLRSGLDSGSFTSEQLVRAYFARIREVNGRLKPVTEINTGALEIARDLDLQRQQVKASSLEASKLGPLHGIPVLVPINMGTDDDMDTTAGSYALVGARVPEDSTVVAKLRQAGAIILGKTNMPQWAALRDGSLSIGWSAVGGTTTNAYISPFTPKPDSGGAVAASIGLTWASLGTDSSADINIQAGNNNVVGFRPTVGLTSRHMVVPVAERLDTIGTFTRTVKDAAYLMQVIAGQDSKDSYTAQIPFETIPDYVAACSRTDLEGTRLGASPEAMQALLRCIVDLPANQFSAALSLMHQLGAIICDNIPMREMSNGFELSPPEEAPSYLVRVIDFATDLPKYTSKLKTNPNNIHSLRDLRDFTRRLAEEGGPNGPTRFWDAVIDGNIDTESPTYKRRLERDTECFVRIITGALEEFHLDALVFWGPEVSVFCSRIGLPAITVPFGQLHANAMIGRNRYNNVLSAPGKPYGITFVGRPFSEERLFSIAYAFEQATQARTKVHPLVGPVMELADIIKP